MCSSWSVGSCLSFCVWVLCVYAFLFMFVLLKYECLYICLGQLTFVLVSVFVIVCLGYSVWVCVNVCMSIMFAIVCVVAFVFLCVCLAWMCVCECLAWMGVCVCVVGCVWGICVNLLCESERDLVPVLHLIVVSCCCCCYCCCCCRRYQLKHLISWWQQVTETPVHRHAIDTRVPWLLLKWLKCWCHQRCLSAFKPTSPFPRRLVTVL